MKNFFNPIQVGCAHADFDLKILRDDKIGSLSPKNKYFCELTAMDEIAKSINNEQYIGLMHYRRVFSSPNPRRYALQSLKFHTRLIKNRFGMGKNTLELHLAKKICTPTTLERALSDLTEYVDTHKGNFDIIVPTAARLGSQSIREHYAKVHHVEHYDLFLERLSCINPKLNPYINSQAQKRRAYFFNMFIMRSDLFIEYWSSLVSTLLSIEKDVNPDRIEGYQSRVFGFLAERYMNIFVDYAIEERRAIKKELPVAMCYLPEG
jgi:hypothetical protein